MEERKAALNNLNIYLQTIDKEVTMVLQTLQWDRTHLLEGIEMVNCNYDQNHRIPLQSKEDHEGCCIYLSQGYKEGEQMLPDPPDTDSNTVVRLDKEKINEIIGRAPLTNPQLKKGLHNEDSCQEPLTLDRLQSTYTSDERRAIHDAVVAANPELLEEMSDLPLPGADVRPSDRGKSRAQVLAELRDMKRRRTKYRVASKTKNYSDVLRDVIKTQMEVYTEVQNDVQNKPKTDNNNKTHAKQSTSRDVREDNNYHADKRIENTPKTDKHAKDNQSKYSEFSKESKKWEERERHHTKSDRNRENRDKFREKKDKYRDDKNKYREDNNKHRENWDKHREDKNKYKEDKNKYSEVSDRSEERNYKRRIEHRKDHYRSSSKSKQHTSSIDFDVSKVKKEIDAEEHTRNYKDENCKYQEYRKDKHRSSNYDYGTKHRSSEYYKRDETSSSSRVKEEYPSDTERKNRHKSTKKDYEMPREEYRRYYDY